MNMQLLVVSLFIGVLAFAIPIFQMRFLTRKYKKIEDELNRLGDCTNLFPQKKRVKYYILIFLLFIVIVTLVILLFKLYLSFIFVIYVLEMFLLYLKTNKYSKYNGIYHKALVYNEILFWNNISEWKMINKNIITLTFINGLRKTIDNKNHCKEIKHALIVNNIKEEI